MSIELLQKKIRKLKNPSVVDITPVRIPPHLLNREGSVADACAAFCTELLEGLKGIVPAVRFNYNTFALLGAGCLERLPGLMELAGKLEYYVLLEGTQSLSEQEAAFAAQVMQTLPCDGMLVSPYIGSDGIKPYVKRISDNGKSLFVTLRTANKTASELQELMTGRRLVYMAAADIVNRLGEPLVGSCGYSQVAGVAAANAPDSLRFLRAKYKTMFLLVDGYDYSNSNAKNCAIAFDRLGHGAAVCAGASVTGAWELENTDGTQFVEQAIQAAERMKKNLLRHITVL